MEYYQWIVREKTGLWLQLVVAALGGVFCLPNKTVRHSSSDNSSCPYGYRGGQVTGIQKITISQPLHYLAGGNVIQERLVMNLTHLNTSCCLASAKLWSWISSPRKACVGGGNEAKYDKRCQVDNQKESEGVQSLEPWLPLLFFPPANHLFIARPV